MSRICRCRANSSFRNPRRCLCTAGICGGCLHNAPSASPPFDSLRAALEAQSTPASVKGSLMSSRPIGSVRMISLSVALLGALAAVTPRTGMAFDRATFAAWHRTWHAPNGLETPLRPYFIPRFPGRCDRAAYAEGYGCEDLNGNAAYAQGRVGYAAPCETGNPLPPCAACLSVRSERLGQIPNDLEAGAAATVGAPGR
jgi:hypothetical protein